MRSARAAARRVASTLPPRSSHAPRCGTTLKFEDYVGEFASINDEKALDYIGKGQPHAIAHSSEGGGPPPKWACRTAAERKTRIPPTKKVMG